MTEFELRARFGAPAIAKSLAANPSGAEDRPALSDHALAIANRFSYRAIAPRMVSGLLRLVELLAVLLIGLIVHRVTNAETDYGLGYVLALAITPLATILFLQTLRAYDSTCFGSVADQLVKLFVAWTVVFTGIALAIFTFNLMPSSTYSWFVAWYCLGVALLFAGRCALAIAVRGWNRDGRFRRRAIIVGGGESAADLIRSLEAPNENFIQICGIFDDRSGDRSPAIVQGYPRLGAVAELVEFARIAKIDMLIVSLPITAENRLLSILRTLWVLPVDIRLSAHTDKLRFRPRSYSYIGTVPFLDVIEKPIADWDALTKRVFDLLVAGICVLCLMPLLIATALAIRIDSPGPILFRQKRYGFNNEIIDVFKFRSMFVQDCDDEAKKAVTRDDRRVTRVGRIIRKSSIDELPQLFNVIIGGLSLVGPRPHAVGSNTGNRLWESVVDGYFARHKVRPGVTGWAQVHGWRGEVDTPEKLRARIAYDLNYIENWSLLLDLKILLRTPFKLFDTTNAF